MDMGGEIFGNLQTG